MEQQKIMKKSKKKLILVKAHKLKIKKTTKPRIIDVTMDNLGTGFNL